MDSEVAALRTVLLHRPGPELARLTPRNSDRLLFDGIPWVARAAEEHDTFAATLRDRGVEVLLLADLLHETLRDPAARAAGVGSAVDEAALGPRLADELRAHLSGLDAGALARALIAGITFEELPGPATGLVRRMHDPRDFAIAPLPNLLFTRDSSVWIGDRVAGASLAMPARRRETSLVELVYAHHPRFRGTARMDTLPVEGGDVLLLGDGVVAVGVGQRTTPAGAESFARSVLAAGLARTVLAVPIEQSRASMHLDTVCTVVDTDAVVMYPVELCAYPLTLDGSGGLRIAGPVPLLAAAAEARGLATLHVIETGLDPVTAEREQWDDGNNTLAVAPGVVVAYERNTATNRRLAEAGIEVLTVAGSELGSGRGGPRCMSCPVARLGSTA